MDKKEWQLKRDNLIILGDQLRQEMKNDPLLNIVLRPDQKEFADNVFFGKESENWLFTANRWGKSLVGAYCGAKLARFGDPVTGRPTSGWVVSVDSNVSRDIIEPMYFDNGHVPACNLPPFIPDNEIADWRKRDKVLKLKNTSIVGFKSCESKGKKFPGATRQWIQFDEPPLKSVYDEAGIRIGAGQQRLRIFGTCTLLPPEGVIGGISWMYNEIIKRQHDLPHVKVFTGSIYQNYHLDKKEIAILESRYPEGTLQNRIRLKGELLPGISGARVYSSFDRQLHVKKDMSIFNAVPLAWIWDFNVEPMVTYVGQRHGNNFKIFREFVLDEGNIFEMVTLFKQAFPTHGAEIHIYGDATGNYRNVATNSSNYNVIMRSMASYPVPVKLRLPERNPSVQDRVNAVNMALKDEIGAVNLHISPACPELIQDFEEVLSDSNGGIRKTRKMKDPYYRRTHMTDAIGYWVTYEAPARASSVYFNRRSSFVVPGEPRYVLN